MKLLFIIILGIVAVIVLFIALGVSGLYPNILSDKVQEWFSGFSLSGFFSNPMSVLTAGGGILAVAIPLYSKFSAAKQQAQQIALDANTKLKSYSSELETATGKLTTTTANLETAKTTITELDKAKSTAEASLSTLQANFDKLQTHYTELQKIKGADFLSGLPAGTTIKQPDGSTITTVEKTVVK